MDVCISFHACHIGGWIGHSNGFFRDFQITYNGMVVYSRFRTIFFFVRYLQGSYRFYARNVYGFSDRVTGTTRASGHCFLTQPDFPVVWQQVDDGAHAGRQNYHVGLGTVEGSRCRLFLCCGIHEVTTLDELTMFIRAHVNLSVSFRTMLFFSFATIFALATKIGRASSSCPISYLMLYRLDSCFHGGSYGLVPKCRQVIREPPLPIDDVGVKITGTNVFGFGRGVVRVRVAPFGFDHSGQLIKAVGDPYFDDCRGWSLLCFLER